MKSKFFYITALHFLNDGFSASLFLFLPFIAKDLGLNLAQVGLLGGGLNFLPIFVALPAMVLAKKFGHFKTVLMAVLFYALGFLAMGLAGNFIILLFLLIGTGLGFGLFHPIAFALISRISNFDNIGRQMGDFTAWGDIGRVVISGAVSFIVTAIAWRNAAFCYGGIALLFLVYLYFFHFRRDYIVDYEQSTAPKGGFKILASHPKFIFAVLVCGLDNLASSALFMFLPFLLLSKSIQPIFLSSFASALLVGYILGKMILGRWVDKIGPAKVFIFTEIVMAGLIVLLTLVHAFWLVVLVSVLLGIATRGTVPATRSMLHLASIPSQNFEAANSIAEVASSSASVLAPLALGFVSNSLGINWAFWVAALFACLAVLPALFFVKIHPVSYPQELIDRG